MHSYNEIAHPQSERCKNIHGHFFPGDLPEGRQFIDWTTFKEYTLSHTTLDDPSLYYALYNGQDKPTQASPKLIHGIQRREPGDLTTAVVTYCKVTWQDTFLLQHHPNVCKDMGYTPLYTSSPILNPTPQLPYLLQHCVSPQNPVLRVQWGTTKEQLHHMETSYGLHWKNIWAQAREEERRYKNFSYLTPLQQQGIWEPTRPRPIPCNLRYGHQIKITPTTPIHPVSHDNRHSRT
jgi:hypothetical protein